MSEEEQIFNKMIYCNLINGEQALKFNRKYKDLQQKLEQLEKENKILRENAEHNDKVVDKVNWENMVLKGKLKDLKERIMLKQLRLANEETYNILNSDLNEPNIDDPLNEEVNAIFKSNRAQGEKTAREWTKKYAI